MERRTPSSTSLALPIARSLLAPSRVSRRALRNAAARHAANTDPNADLPFYWEIGDVNGAFCYGTVGAPAIDPSVAINIASATKWLFGAYCAQVVALGADDWQYLNMTSGYNSMNGQCTSGQTVAQCLATTGYDTFTPLTQGHFYYNSAHFEHFAVNRTVLGPNRIVALRAAFEAALGVSPIQWTQPLMAGGAFMTPATYVQLLRSILAGNLTIASLLGTHQVPASDAAAAPNTVVSPAPSDEFWYYSVGHWVEPDGSFSSPGTFGFYPWISADKTQYGIVARTALSGGEIGLQSVETGQRIRNAWNNA